MWNTSLDGMAFWCFVGGSTDFYPHTFICRIRYLCSDVSRARSPQRCVRKDVDTSNTAALTVLWKSLDLLVAPNWFLYTDTVNDYTRIFLYSCGIPSNNLFLMPVCVSNVHHLSQLPCCLVVLTLYIPLVVLRMPLVIISRR